MTWNFPESSYTSGDVPPGIYTFTFDVSTESSNQSQVTKQFTVQVELTDLCANPIVTTADLSNVEVTITEADLTISSLFTVDPPFCVAPGGDSLSIDPIQNMSVITDPSTQELTIAQVTDTLAPSNPNNTPGQTLETYFKTVTYTYMIPSGETKTVTNDLILTVKNPCVDQNFVYISP